MYVHDYVFARAGFNYAGFNYAVKGPSIKSSRFIRYKKNSCFARLPVDIRLTALIAMSVVGYISIEFERESNAVATVKYIMVLENLQTW